MAEEPADVTADRGVTNRSPERTDPKAAEINFAEGADTDLERLSLRAQFRSGPHHVPK